MLNRCTKMLIVILFVFGIIMSGFQGQVSAAEQVAKGTITVQGNKDTGTILPSTDVTYMDGETAFDALVKAIGENNIQYTFGSNGKVITGINGLGAQGTNEWCLYINGVSAKVIGVDNFIVQDGDQLDFRYVDLANTPQKTASLKVIITKENVVMNAISNIEIIGQPTALQLLRVAIGSENVGMDTKYTTFINNINHINPDGTNYWFFYVNGKSASVGADSYPLQPGDQISFQYESWQAPSGDANGGVTKPATGTVTKSMLEKAINGASQFTLKHPISDWDAIAFKQIGKNIPVTYLENIKKLVKDKNGHFSKITDLEKYTLSILATEGDPTNIEGYNLVESIYNGNVTKQGLNGVAYALIALDSANFQVPKTATWTREKLINQLVEKQNKDGGWTWDGTSTSDPDTTAMVLTALAPYKDQAIVKDKVNSAVQFLSTKFLNHKIDNSSTTAQVIIALSALGIDANGSQFSKDGSSLANFLLSFQNADGGFYWQSKTASDVFSTEQAFLALAAYKLKLDGKGSLYHLPLTVKTTVHSKAVKKTSNQQGHSLPNTATNSFNLLVMGTLIILVGIFFYAIQRRQKLIKR